MKAGTEEMKAGRNLDALIAEKIFSVDVKWEGKVPCDGEPYFTADNERVEGYFLNALPHYSTDISDAYKVVEHIQNTLGKSVAIYNRAIIAGDQSPYGCQIENRFYNGEPDTWFSGWVELAPLAICLAALKAVGHVDKIQVIVDPTLKEDEFYLI